MTLSSLTTLLLAASVATVTGGSAPGCPSGDETSTPTTSSPTTPTPTTPTTPTPTPPIGFSVTFTELDPTEVLEVKPVQFVCYTIGSCFAGGTWGRRGYVSNDDRVNYYALALFNDAECVTPGPSSLADVALHGQTFYYPPNPGFKSFAIVTANNVTDKTTWNRTTTSRVRVC